MYLKPFKYYFFYVLLSTSSIIESQVFTDVSNVVGLGDVSSFTETFGTGASIADYDNDGDLDFVVGTEFGISMQLYNNNGDGTFSDIAISSGIQTQYRIRSSLWFDFDSDNLLDIILLGDCYEVEGCINAIEIFLYKQNPDHSFTLNTSSGLDFGSKYLVENIGTRSVIGGIAAGDINNDNYLDLLVTIWGGPMTMFLNNGDGTYSDVSSPSGLGLTSTTRHQPTFHDFNRDGYLDIYINVDFEENEFWINNGDTTFNEIAASLSADSAFNEMGIAVGDFDNDLDFDLYATNITRLQDGIQQHNILLKNNIEETGNLGFTEVAQQSAFQVGDSGWDWGTIFFDSDNDGFLDLATTNGWETNNWPADQSKLWKNIDGIFFQDISMVSQFNDSWSALTLLSFDMDRDGDLDILQTMKVNVNQNLQARIYDNDARQNLNPNNYLVIKPRMNGPNHFSIGTVVKIEYNNGQNRAMRLITAGTSFYGQEAAEAFFGLGDYNTIDELKIEWPDNTTTVLNNIAVNQILTVNNSSILSESDSYSKDNVRVYPNPFKNILNISGIKWKSELSITNIVGQQVCTKNLDVNDKNLDLSFLSKGTYIIKIVSQNNQENYVTKLIKL